MADEKDSKKGGKKEKKRTSSRSEKKGKNEKGQDENLVASSSSEKGSSKVSRRNTKDKAGDSTPKGENEKENNEGKEEDNEDFKTTIEGVVVEQMSFFSMSAKVNIFTCSWIPKNPKAGVFLFHGFGEYFGRYKNFIAELNAQSYAVFALDHQGHGRSEGPRANISDFGEYIFDTLQFMDLVCPKYPELPIFIFGHSMGGAIAILTARACEDELLGVVLSAPAVKRPDEMESAFSRSALLTVSNRLPKLPIKKLNPDHVSRNKEFVEAHKKDPLVFHGKMSARMCVEMLKVMEQIEEQVATIKFPFLVCQGSADRIANPSGAKMLAEKATSVDKTLRMWEGCYHNLLNEPEKEEIIACILEWLEERTNKHYEGVQSKKKEKKKKKKKAKSPRSDKEEAKSIHSEGEKEKKRKPRKGSAANKDEAEMEASDGAGKSGKKKAIDKSEEDGSEGKKNSARKGK